MKLRQAWIKRYGPLQQDLVFDGNVHVVQGPNESGKSLIVEAILKLLAGDDAVQNARVDEQPEGFVVLNDGVGEQKLTPGDTLRDYYQEAHDYDITPSEIRNIFVVQDADLRIHNEDQFYERITDRITGIRTQDIRRIQSELLDTGRLTPERENISTAARHNDAGDQLEKARDLCTAIDTYINNSDNVTTLEGRLLDARLAKRHLEEEEQKLKEAEKKDEYNTLVAQRDRIQKNLNDLEDIPEESLVTEILRRLETVTEGDHSELTDRKERYTAITKWGIVSTAITFAVVLAASAPPVTFTIPTAILALAGYSAFQMRKASARLASRSRKRESILQQAHSIHIDVDSINELQSELRKIQDRRSSLEAGISEAKGVLSTRLNITADAPKATVERAEDQLDELRRSINMDVEVEFTQDKLDEVRRELRDKTSEIEQLEEILTEHQNKVQEFSEKAQQLDFRAFTGDSLDIEITNLAALETLLERLDEFIEQVETDAELSRTAVRVFERLEESEEEKVSKLFGQGSEATEVFSDLTGDRYELVRYDSQSNEAIVERTNGQSFTPADLSKGTRDQLYLSIRVALARELPATQNGFFIMDEAFLTADPDRLQRLTGLVEHLAEQGWQIIYLTAQSDAVDTMKPLASGLTVLNRLP